MQDGKKEMYGEEGDNRAQKEGVERGEKRKRKKRPIITVKPDYYFFGKRKHFVNGKNIFFNEILLAMEIFSENNAVSQAGSREVNGEAKWCPFLKWGVLIKLSLILLHTCKDWGEGIPKLIFRSREGGLSRWAEEEEWLAGHHTMPWRQRGSRNGERKKGRKEGGKCFLLHGLLA